MKTLCGSLGAIGAIAVFFTAAPTGASTITIGTSLARSCFESAELLQSNPDKLSVCDRALHEEALNQQDRAATLVNRGILHYVDRRYSTADRDFDEAIALNPTEPEAWLNKAILSIRMRNSASAFPLIERAIALNTRKPALAYYVRGIAFEEAGNVKAAYADLVRARDLDPKWADPQTELKRYRVK